jgi:hypothetical protein
MMLFTILFFCFFVFFFYINSKLSCELIICTLFNCFSEV